MAKTASGALERQPYLRVRNLADAIVELQNMGFLVLGLDGEADETIETALGGKLGSTGGVGAGGRGAGIAAENQRNR